MGPGRRGADAADIVLLRDDTASLVLPMRVIFFETSSVSGREGFLKGGFWRPIFPPTRNFWLEGGIERSVATRSERSVMVASCAKDNAIAFPWCVRVISMLVPDVVGAEDASASVMARSLYSVAKGCRSGTRIGIIPRCNLVYNVSDKLVGD